MTFHLADAITAITHEEAETIGAIVRAFTHLSFRVIGKRGAICHWPSEEPIQFVTRREPKRVRWMAEGWNAHFSELAEKGRAR